MALFIINLILAGVFSILYFTPSGSGGFGIGDAMGKGIMLMFIFPILTSFVNFIACFVLYPPSFYFLLTLLPLLYPSQYLLNAHIKKKRFSAFYFKHAPILEQIIDETLAQFEVEKKQFSHIRLPQQPVKHNHDIVLSLNVFTRGATDEQKEMIKTEIERRTKAIYPRARDIFILG